MNNIHVILVEPVYKGNIGSVARIMNNFEFCNLRIVGKIPEKEDFVIGVHSEDILQSAVIFDSFPKAIKDMDRVIAVSRRQGAKKLVDFNPKQLAEYVNTSEKLKIGLVFGRETFGLTDEEADLCDLRCYIKANDNFPSLNLAQAAGVILYEIYSITETRQKQTSTSKKALIQSSIDYSIDVLESISIFKTDDDKNKIKDYLHTLLYRSNATKQMTTDLKKLFNRIHKAFHGKGMGWKGN